MKIYNSVSFGLAIGIMLFTSCGPEPFGKDSLSIDPRLNRIEEEIIEAVKEKKVRLLMRLSINFVLHE